MFEGQRELSDLADIVFTRDVKVNKLDSYLHKMFSIKPKRLFSNNSRAVQNDFGAHERATWIACQTHELTHSNNLTAQRGDTSQIG
jgi:hypothetical protein